MELSDRAEEILETLWTEIVEQEQDGCDARILRDDKTLEELLRAGLVKIRNDKLTMTVIGRHEARNCIRRHRLAERLFADVLDVKGEAVHENSCKFEHMLCKGLDENICIMLGHPKTCPHGKAIPEGKCCTEMKGKPQKLILPLTDLKTNSKANVSWLQTRDRSALQKMIAMGILPNSEIRLIQKFPSYVLQIGRSQFAIDRELARHVYVRQV